jgi:hypothetical protein
MGDASARLDQPGLRELSRVAKDRRRCPLKNIEETRSTHRMFLVGISHLQLQSYPAMLMFNAL